MALSAYRMNDDTAMSSQVRLWEHTCPYVKAKPQHADSGSGDDIAGDMPIEPAFEAANAEAAEKAAEKAAAEKAERAAREAERAARAKRAAKAEEDERERREKEDAAERDRREKTSLTVSSLPSPSNAHPAPKSATISSPPEDAAATSGCCFCPCNFNININT